MTSVACLLCSVCLARQCMQDDEFPDYTDVVGGSCSHFF